MKKLSVVFLLMLSLSVSSAQRVVIDDCLVTRHYFGGSHSFYAYGNVYIETNPKEPVDLRIKIVDNPAYSTFCVLKTTDTPRSCGEWRFVKDRSQASFTIRYVKEGEDCTICFVSDRKKTGMNLLHH